MTHPKLICLTPVRNEIWIIKRFLECASLWADTIIVADQQSTDGTRDIAKKFPKVKVIDNPVSEMFNEYQMRRRLFEEARKIKGPKILFALDADEAFTANLFTSKSWHKLNNLAPGTLINFRWANLKPGCRTYWSPDFYLTKGFVDDGTPYKADRIHTVNLPIPAGAPVHQVKDIRILHYQYTDWQRMESKHRWYQVWEWLNNPSRNALDIYRQYHHMDAVPKNTITPLPFSWLDHYQKKGINMTKINQEGYWWDNEVRRLIASHPPGYFAPLSIWNLPASPQPSLHHRLVHLYLRLSQRYTNRMVVQYIDKYLPRFWGQHPHG